MHVAAQVSNETVRGGNFTSQDTLRMSVEPTRRLMGHKKTKCVLIKPVGEVLAAGRNHLLYG
jgi:hypothetical protein